MRQDFAKDFFVSYTTSDRPWAEWIAWQLETEGYTTILQAWDFLPGENFVLEMQKATEAAARTLAVLSPSYLNALYTQSEWAAAFAGTLQGNKGCFSQYEYASATRPDFSLLSSTLISLVLMRGQPMTHYWLVSAVPVLDRQLRRVSLE